MLKAERKKLKVREKIREKQEREQQTQAENQQHQSQAGDAEQSLQSKFEELSLEHRHELDECRAQLFMTQKSLAQLVVEKDQATKERDRLAQQLNDGSSVNSEVATLERELQQLKQVYASSLAAHAAEKRKWEEQGAQSANGHLVSVENDNDKIKALSDENRILVEQQQQLVEELESQKSLSQEHKNLAVSHERKIGEKERQWESERTLLQRQLDEQTGKIEDWKLLIQRNKIALEQERLKCEELEQELEEATQKQTHTEVAFDDYQRAADGLQKDLEREMMEKERLYMENERMSREIDEITELFRREKEARSHVEDNLGEQMQSGGTALSVGVTGGGPSRSYATIPSDLVASGGGESLGIHVTELDWEGKDLSGKFTGWLDSAGNPNGHGTLRMEDESVYDGEWKFGEWNGMLTSGLKKKFAWCHLLCVDVFSSRLCCYINISIGYGVYTTADGDLYSGTWKEGKQENRGVYVWSDGCIYTGDYVEGSRDGKGYVSVLS